MSGSLLRKVWHGFAARVSVNNSDVSCVSIITAKRRATISRRLLPVFLGLCACLGSATPAGAVVRYVDADAPSGGDGLSWSTAYESLDTALTAAEPGDQIWVAAGTYVGNFTLALGVEHYGGFAGTETELAQRDWTANPTILDGDQGGSAVTSPYGAAETTRIDGFTVTNGSGTVLASYTHGGGLYLEFSSPTIRNNTITGNSADYGGGLCLWYSSPTIGNNTITGNNSEEQGGGLYLDYYSSPTIANNAITGNSAIIGGGLSLWDSSPTIANNSITGNSASFSGGLYLVYSSPTIANNTITHNIANYGGGGLYLDSSSPTIRNNTITSNSGRKGGGLYLYYSFPTIANNTIVGNSGGGLYLWHSSPTIANNTITGNSGGGLYLWYSSPTIANNTITGNSGGLYLHDSSPTIANTIVAFNLSGIYLDLEDGGAPKLRHNCVYGNTRYNYSGLTDPTGTDGNMSADPRLADPRYGKVHIQPDSPCVDAGSNADASGDFDMDGEPRIQPLDGTVDIGADESDDTVWSTGPYVIVRVSPIGDDANDGSSWPLAKRTVQAGIDAASALGGEVWVQAGTYEECITLHRYAYVYGGFVGGETAREERDWKANVTTLDGQRQGSVVTARGGYRVSAVDGFTITNGSGTMSDMCMCGGGLYLEFSSPTIANNTIVGNSGGGLYLEFSHPRIANNTIADNNANSGGGLYVYHSLPTIVSNTITGNSAAYRGGGLLLDGSSPTIANNTITGNSANEGGGGLSLWSSSPTIANNAIGDNSADSGGGLDLRYSSPTIVNNTIIGNAAYTRGGGLYLYRCSPTIANTIVAFNSSGICRYAYAGTPTLRHNCVHGNTAYDYYGLANPTGIDGNISADPLFVQNPDPGPDGTWGTADDELGIPQLLFGSPCIDAGDNDRVPPDMPDLDDDEDTEEPLPIDLARSPRFFDNAQTEDCPQPGADCGTPPIVDMGAYELVYACGNGVVDPGEECDDGLDNSDTEPDACRTMCVLASCGDSVVDTSEDCDDGNGYPGDGCDPTCYIEHAIPTVSGWGMIVLALSLLVGHKLYFRRRGALR